MAFDMNPMATGYGGNAGMPSPGQNPAQGAQAPQKATSVPGAVSNMVSAIMNGYKQGQGQRPPGLPGAPGAPNGAQMEAAGPPLDLNPQAAFNTPMPPPGGGMPPPMPGGGLPVPFPGAGGIAGLLGGGGLAGLMGGGDLDPQSMAMRGLFGGG